jgi:hypothetical protein
MPILGHEPLETLARDIFQAIRVPPAGAACNRGRHVIGDVASLFSLHESPTLGCHSKHVILCKAGRREVIKVGAKGRPRRVAR